MAGIIHTEGILHACSMNIKTRRAQQSEMTRGALVKVARDLFTERGYTDTATEEIVQRAGVTRGALYHHFRNKEGLFRVVFKNSKQNLMEKVLTATDLTQANPWKQLLAGCQAFLDVCLEPDVQRIIRRIIILDAPSVLGWETWRRINTESLGLLRLGLQASIEAGHIGKQPVDSLALMIHGALNEAAIIIVHAEDTQSARVEVGAVVDRLLNGLTTSKP